MTVIEYWYRWSTGNWHTSHFDVISPYSALRYIKPHLQPNDYWDGEEKLWHIDGFNSSGVSAVIKALLAAGYRIRRGDHCLGDYYRPPGKLT